MNGLKTIQADQMTEKWDFGQIGHQNNLREPVKTPCGAYQVSKPH